MALPCTHPPSLLNNLKLTSGSFFYAYHSKGNEVLVGPLRNSLDFGRTVQIDGERHQKVLLTGLGKQQNAVGAAT